MGKYGTIFVTGILAGAAIAATMLGRRGYNFYLNFLAYAGIIMAVGFCVGLVSDWIKGKLQRRPPIDG